MKGEDAMQSVAKRSVLWVAREILGIKTEEAIWSWGRHWKGHCLESGVDPKTFEVTDWELFELAWTKYEFAYQAKQEARAKKRELKVKEILL